MDIPKHIVLTAEQEALLGRIEERVEKGDDPDSCWIWPGAVQNGKGMIKLDKKPLLVGHVLWECFQGKVRKGYFLQNICGMKRCVRPDSKHQRPVKRGKHMSRESRLRARETYRQHYLSRPLIEVICSMFTETANGCWHWDGKTIEKNLPILHYQGKTHMVRRRVWEAVRGEIPETDVIKRQEDPCPDPLCIQPFHQYQTSRKEASRDSHALEHLRSLRDSRTPEQRKAFSELGRRAYKAQKEKAKVA